MVQTATFQTRSGGQAWPRRKHSCSTTLSRGVPRSFCAPRIPLNHRGRRGAGRAADTDRLVALLHPFRRAPQPSRGGGLVALLGGDRHLGTQRPCRLGVRHHDWSESSVVLTEGGESMDIVVLPLQGERKIVPYLRTRFNETDGKVSLRSQWSGSRRRHHGRLARKRAAETTCTCVGPMLGSRRSRVSRRTTWNAKSGRARSTK